MFENILEINNYLFYPFYINKFYFIIFNKIKKSIIINSIFMDQNKTTDKRFYEDNYDMTAKVLIIGDS